MRGYKKTKKPSLIRREKKRHFDRGFQCYLDNLENDYDISDESSTDDQSQIPFGFDDDIGGGKEKINGCHNRNNSCPFDCWYELLWSLQHEGIIGVNNFEFAANSIYQQNEFRSHLRGDPDTGRDVFITILTNPINKHFQRYGQNITVDMQRKVQVFGAEIVMRVLFGQFMIDIGGPLKISCTCQEYYPCLSLLSNFFPSTLLENVMNLCHCLL